MSTSPTQDPTPTSDAETRKLARQERGALIFSVVAVVAILLIGSPCICYFGAGLFQGVNILRTGQHNNPARQGFRPEEFKRQGADWRGNYKRPDRYNRTFAKPAQEEDMSPDASSYEEPVITP